ncbi:lipopolysaccharide kinase InaA family protein [Halopseudomonas sp.]|uniref:lipopolysaccharide kinase InaA family protein n=1 Tax=Halopseudomonas sp. TaxID=2901191 RepID=UPI003566470D
MPGNVQDLRNSGREPPLPLQVTTPSGPLTINQWLRVLPGQRLVGAGDLAGRPVMAKLFIAPRAKQHWQREKDGLEALQQAGIRTPELVAAGELEHQGFFLCTDYLAGARTLQQEWDALSDSMPGSRLSPGDPQAIALLGQALRSIALMHRAGLIQTDLHMGNFLLHDCQVQVIDGDAIRALSPGQPVGSREAENNLAIFFAQLDAAWDEMMELLLIEYLQTNAERPLNPDRMLGQVKQVRAKRLHDWLAKAVRDCTHFSVEQRWTRFTAVVRERAGALRSLLEAPDQSFAAGPSLKDGGTSSVTLVEADGQPLVIKRYNIKGLAHWLTRFWRPTRAWHSWLAGHRLQFLGIATPAPLAMIESRFGPLRRRAWLLTEFCPGQNLLELFGSDGRILPDKEQGDALLKMVGQLSEARISHGDFKATNLLWYAGQVWLIDLDSMQVHTSDPDFQQGWSKDRARFVRNWPAGSPLADWLQANLPR